MEVINATQANTLMGLFIGTLFTALCLGVLTIQISSYYHTFPTDGRPAKLAVAFLWLLQAFQLACCTQTLYQWSVPDYNNPLVLERGTWEFAISPINMVCSAVTVETFFVYRLYSLSRNLYVGGLVQFLVLLQFGLGVANAVEVQVDLESQMIIKDCTRLAVPWLAIQALADIVIATWMCVLLRRRRTGFQKTDSMLNRMVLYTISTGLITSVLSCFVLVMFVRFGVHFSQVITAMLLGPVYSITMLANLHTRTRLRATLATPTPLELICPIKTRVRRNVGDHRSEDRFRATRINIATEAASDDVDIKPM